MSNKITIPAPTIECQVVISGMSNKTMNLVIPEDLNLTMNLLIAALNRVNQARQQKKETPLIEIAKLGPSALDLVNGGKR